MCWTGGWEASNTLTTVGVDLYVCKSYVSGNILIALLITFAQLPLKCTEIIGKWTIKATETLVIWKLPKKIKKRNLNLYVDFYMLWCLSGHHSRCDYNLSKSSDKCQTNSMVNLTCQSVILPTSLFTSKCWQTVLLEWNKWTSAFFNASGSTKTNGKITSGQWTMFTKHSFNFSSFSSLSIYLRSSTGPCQTALRGFQVETGNYYKVNCSSVVLLSADKRGIIVVSFYLLSK